MNRILISAAHKSSGKTIVTMGLCAALVERGLSVQAFKKGPDYIDPSWLARATKRSCINLDFHTLSSTEIRQRFVEHAASADISIIEGNKGLYDGVNVDGSNSNAALATLLKTPVVLVIDTRGMTRGVAPLLLGYQAFCTDIDIKGVIFNHVGGDRHAAKLQAALEYYTDLNLFGMIDKNPDLLICEQHLGLTPSNELDGAESRIRRMTEVIKSGVDLDNVLDVSAVADFPTFPRPAIPSMPSKAAVRLGVARDTAFGFYYADDLQAFRQQGAELCYFDTLNDGHLPDVDALLFGGGFPERNVLKLSENRAMVSAIRAFVARGLPVYAECGGLMYLGRSITQGGETYPMVGVLPADSIMRQRPRGKGYMQLRISSQHPWFNFLSTSTELSIPAHEFHYSEIVNISDRVAYAYEVKRGSGITGSQDGLIYGNIFASYAHLRNTEAFPWCRLFLEQIRAVKDEPRHRVAM